MFENNLHLNFVERALQATNVEKNVIADNIANYNTPQFKASKVDFQKLMEEPGSELATTDPNHMGDGAIEKSDMIYQDTTTKERFDGNNVNLNEEMVNMVKTNYRYNLGIQALNQELSLNKTAMK